jgi:predicted small lipoprotein YifL
MRFFLFRSFLLLCAIVALNGCGKKGALYLPDASVPVPASNSAAPQPIQPAQQ